MASHARANDPWTSHEAARTINMNAQRHRVLGAYYRHRHEMIDHQAYIYCGMPQAGWAHQRCSDLRDAEWIELTGNIGRTPSNKSARMCIITDKGIKAYEAYKVADGEADSVPAE